LLDGPAEFIALAIDVDTEEARSSIGAGFLVFVDHRPDDLAVGVGDRERLDILEIVPAEFALVHVPIDDLDRNHDTVVEQQPVGLALKGSLGDQTNQADVVDIDMDAGFFGDLPLGALCGGFANMHLELSADRGAEALVGFFDPMEEKDSAVLISEIAQAGELIRQCAVGGVFGKSGQDVGWVAHGQR